MKVTAKQLESRLQAFTETCRRAGVRITPQRQEIFRVVASINDHPDVEAIRERLRERLPNLSLDTIYRALSLFAEMGLLTKVGLAADRARFDANQSPHHHFICTVCGAIADVTDAGLDRIKPPASMRRLGEVRSTHVQMRGICTRCRRTQRS